MFEDNSVESDRRNLVPCGVSLDPGFGDLTRKEARNSSVLNVITYAEFELALEVSWLRSLRDALEDSYWMPRGDRDLGCELFGCAGTRRCETRSGRDRVLREASPPVAC
jgi:hypothetical protein